MHIIMFSINPLFPGYGMGGAPKHLQNVALYLGKLGHDITIFCTQPEDANQPFRWHERVQVLPILRFKQPFPQPYAIPAYDMASAIQDIGEYLQNADRFYMHDGEFLFPYVYRHIPTVISLRDNVYPETLLGGFLFQADTLILISNYAKAYFQHTVGRFFPDYHQRIKVIYNGIDWEKFKPTPPNKILELIPIKPDMHIIILHPHRPEDTKGIWQTIAVVDLLVHRYGFTNIKTLVPRWLDTGLSTELRGFYDKIQDVIDHRDLTDNFIFHAWISQDLMSEYYSLGHVTLALGSFVESFGNAVYESLGCGTPAVVTRISSHREVLPENMIDKVDFGDIESAAQSAARIINAKERTRPQILDYLIENYSVDRQLKAYADIILNARITDDLHYRLVPFDEHTRFQLAPWCYVTGQRIYHDFHADYVEAENILRLIELYPGSFNFAESDQLGIQQDEIMGWYRNGYFVPVLPA